MFTIHTSHLMTYETEEMRYTVLGGIRVDVLDRMRVTLKIEVMNRKYGNYLNNPELANLSIRQNLDLYNDSQVHKLIGKLSDRMEMGASQIALALNVIATT